MDSGKTHMHTVSRRTRSRWDAFYRNCHNEVKGKARGSEGKGVEKQEHDMNSKDTGRFGKLERAESSARRRKRREAPKVDVSGNGWEAENAGMGDDEVTHLNEVVVSNESSLKMEPESRSGSKSKLGSVDCVVSCSSMPVENVGLIIDEGKDSSQARPLNEGSGQAVVIDLVNADYSEDSGMQTDGSETSCSPESISESESSGENSSSDEDYVESSSSDDSEVSYSQERNGRNDYDSEDVDDDHDSSVEIIADIGSSMRKIKTIHFDTKEGIGKNVKKESSPDGDDNCRYSDENSCVKTCSHPKMMEGVVFSVDGDEKLQGVGKSSKMHLKKRNREADEGGKRAHSSGTGTLPEAGLSMKEAEFIVESDVKRRRNSGVDVVLGQGSLGHCPGSKSSIPKIEKDEFSSPVDNGSGFFLEPNACHGKHVLKRSHHAKKFPKTAEESIQVVRDGDMIKKMFADSMNALRENLFRAEESDPMQVKLPLKFRFEDEVQPPRERSEWEKEIDSLFCDLEMGLRECAIGCTKSSENATDETISLELDESPAARCKRGEHHATLDEEIGIRCEYCETVLVQIKHVLPPFYTPPWGLRDRKGFGESQRFNMDEINLEHDACKTPDPSILTKGTVWDLMPGMEKELYPHQREGFEFLWRNIAGDVSLDKLKRPISDGGRGCIISHAPGTGKTRLTIAFLLAFMKLYPTCLPVIVAPCGMLLTWEDEFVKWKVDIPFFNMNKEELSCNTNSAADNFLKLLMKNGGMSIEHIRLVKLHSWMKSRGVLGISYRLFEKLAGENQRGRQNEDIKKQLLEAPGILVLDEGHTARSSKSLVWKVLTKVVTQRRIMLTGTPFQNNFDELYNTLCLVNPKFAENFECNESKSASCKRRGRKIDEAKSKWMYFASSVCKDRDDSLKKLRALIDPFVHVHKGSILQESLPGMRNTLVFLHPSELQKTLLETATKELNIFSRIQMVSLVSVHPSLVAGLKRFSDHKNELEDIKSSLDAGVKIKFVFNLVALAGAQGERVLVFSQFLDPLVFIKEQLKSQLSWHEGRQVLYMDGQSDVNHRQESISSFNDQSSDAKVLLASQRACSEGINLVGASRVVLIDTVWNPSVERQAISRAFRLGQKKFVYVYRLMTSGMEFMQYIQQAEKKRISKLIFSPVEDSCDVELPCAVPEDKVLDAVMNLDNFSHNFARILHNPKESDLVEILNAVDV